MGSAIEDGFFEDPVWVEAWDVQAANVYLDALEADLEGRPYDVAQALLAVISDDELADPDRLARRHRDHTRIDRVVTSRVDAEDRELATHSARVLGDRMLQPLNRWSARRCPSEARRKVWHNTLELRRARLVGPETLGHRLSELEKLSADRIDDLLAPGQVIIRLAVVGSGVVLPPAAGPAPGRADSTAGAGER